MTQLGDLSQPDIIENEVIRLDVGSGYHPRARIDGFAHVDIDPAAHWLDVRSDAMTLPYPNNSVTEIWCSHTIEHLRPQQVVPFLAELRRVLGRNCWMRLATPHFPNLAQAMEEVSLGQWVDMQGAIFSTYDKEEHDLHKCMFNFRILAKLLQQQGFVDIRDDTRALRDVHDEAWTELMGGRHLSLKVTARKP